MNVNMTSFAQVALPCRILKSTPSVRLSPFAICEMETNNVHIYDCLAFW